MPVPCQCRASGRAVPVPGAAAGQLIGSLQTITQGMGGWGKRSSEQGK